MRSRLLALLELTRPHNALAATLLTGLGAYLAGPAAPVVAAALVRAGLVVWLVVAACNVVNDLRDVAADQLNNPRRPIPSGRVTPGATRLLALLLAGAALALAWSLGPAHAAVALGLLALGAGYSFGAKGTVLLGNLLVAGLAATPVFWGAWVAGRVTAATVAAGTLVFLFVLMREILGTLSDCDGDARAGLSTLATRWGLPPTLRLLQGLTLAFAAASVAPWALGLAPIGYLALILLCSTLPAVVVVARVSRAPGSQSLRTALDTTKLLWFTSLLPLLLLRQ